MRSKVGGILPGQVDAGGDIGGEGELDTGALAGLAFGMDVSAVKQDDVLDDGEPETGAAALAGTALIDAVETLEDMGQVFLGDPHPIVLDGAEDPFFILGELKADLNPGKLAGISKGIVD